MRSAKRTRALNGEFCASRAPFGYAKDPANPRKLIIDEEAAETVQRIFRLCADGLGAYQITTQLARDKVLTPSSHEYERSGKLGKWHDPEYPWDWKARTVEQILRNQAYIGHTVSHKQTTKSFKNPRVIAVPKEEWIVAENTHAPIVDKALFERVQTIVTVKKRDNKQNAPNMFAGLLVCADCGARLNLHSSSGGGKNKYFHCNSYRHGTRTGEYRLCTSHATKLGDLESLALTLIRLAVSAALDADRFVASLLDSEESGSSERKTLARLKKRQGELKILAKRAFEQNALGRIDDGMFSDLCADYQEEQKDVTARIEAVEKRLSEFRNREANARRFTETVSKYTDARELSREMLLDLIEKIVAHQPVGTRGENRSQRLDFHFRFIGEIPDNFFKGLVSL